MVGRKQDAVSGQGPVHLRRWAGMPLVLAIWVVLSPAQAQVQRSMLNPSFESPALTSGAAGCYGFTSSASVPGWTSTEPTGANGGDCTGQVPGPNAIEIWRNSFQGVPAFAGAQHVELNAHSAARLSQSICMQNGDTVTWAYSHRARSANTENATFSVGGASNAVHIARTSTTGSVSTSTCVTGNPLIAGASCAGTASTSNWGRYTGTFTWQGSGGDQSIGFEATNGGSLGNFLDDVSFTLKPLLEFPSATLTSLESAGTVNFQLRIAGIVPAGGIAVPFTITGTATGGGVDYTRASTFTVPAGDYDVGSLVNVPVTLVNDALPEGTETVILTITPPASGDAYRLGSTVTCGGTAIGSATLSITDDDVSVTLNKALVPVSNGGVFNLSITGGSPTGGVNPASNQGHGGSTGAVKVNPSSVITLTETAGTSTSLSNYSTAFSCVDGSAASVAVTGSGTSRSITTPALTASAAARTISCTYTNTAALATLTLRKTLAGDRLGVSDQFSVAIRTGGVSGTVVSSATNATTTGTAATVTAGTGTTGSYTAAVGTSYTLTEAAAAGASLANYSATLSCVDTAGVQTGLPSGAAFNPAAGHAITAVAGAALSCTITNTPILVQPATRPVISCSSDGNIFNTAYNGGNPAGLDNVWERGATFGAAQPSNWTLATVATTNPGWSAYNAFPASRFVAHQANTDHTPLGSVDLWYRYVFTMDPSVVLSSFRLAMDFYADNSVQAIYVNGALQTVAGVPDSNPYNALHYNTGNALSANLTNNWQAGTNTILVRVSSGPNAIGFMAKNAISAVCQSNVSLQKALGGLGRLAATDQFTVDIRTGGVSGTVVNSTTNSTTLGSGATVTAGSGNTGVYSSTAGTAYTLNEAMAAGSASALSRYTRTLSCTNVGGTTNVTGFSSLPLTFSPASGDNVLCTVTNTPMGAAVTGRVFLDNGVSSGIANDGLINGGEAGLAGVTVRLTNCAAVVHASGTTDGTGAYNLGVPTGIASGAPLCVEQTNQGARISTGASASSTALPSGTPTTVASTSYTYTRTSTPDRIAFAYNGTGHGNLNLGDVDASTFAANGAKSGQPDTTVTYPHIFTSGTSGSVSFTISGVTSAPTLHGWSEKIFADPGCTGALQAGAAQLYPPVAAAIPVVFNQKVCVIMQEFIPGTVQLNYSNDVTLQANFSHGNASPALPTASYTLHDITTVGTSTLELKKEVRNVTQGVLIFGINNQAKSGETLEYRITYTNNAATPITNLMVNDTTPVYTTFVASSTGTTPATLTACTKNTPLNPLPQPAVSCSALQTAGGTGGISWRFAGSLSPSGTGDVLFQVKVD
ncbi:MAG: conserved repeat domain protein [Polaromonas sp.]|nr:conserved repeat domain protein [Polaromonas sp.]